MLFQPFLPRLLPCLPAASFPFSILSSFSASGIAIPPSFFDPMGLLLSCMSCQSAPASPTQQPPAIRRSSTSSRRGGGGGAKAMEIDEQALAAAAALVLGQRHSTGGVGGAFDRSASVRYAAKRQQQGPAPLPRSSSTRPRSLGDPELQPQQLLAKVSTHPPPHPSLPSFSFASRGRVA